MTGWATRVQFPGNLVRPRRVGAPGGPTKGEASGPHWRKTSHGYYVPASVDGEIPEQRILEQAQRLPQGGALAGWSSLRWRGAGYLDGVRPDGRTRIPVRLAVGTHNIRADEQVDILREYLDPSEIEIVRGVPCTTVGRSLFDEVRRLPIVQAIVAADMTSAAGLITVRDARSYVAQRSSARGVRHALLAMGQARDGSAFPNETRTRLIWSLRAQLPEPLLNCPIFDRDGLHLATVDLLDPESGLVAEFDGADHRTAHRHRDDVLREDRLRRAGLEVVRVTGPDLKLSGLVADRLRAGYGRACTNQVREWRI